MKASTIRTTSTERTRIGARGFKPLVRPSVGLSKWLLIFGILSWLAAPACVIAADDDFGSAAIVGMGGAYVADPSEAATIWFNPALSSLSGSCVRADLATRNLYQVQAGEEKTGSLVFRVGQGVSLGSGFSQFGQSGLYKETDAVLGVGMEFRKNWAIGSGIHYHRVEFGDNVKAYAGASLDVGLAARPSPQIITSAVVRRIAVERLYESNDPPAIAELSAAWEGPSITLAGIWSKERGVRSQFGIGQSLSITKNLPWGAGLVFLSGLRFDPVRYSLGARICGRGVSLDYVFQSHPDLGGTHTIGASFRFPGP